MSRRAAAGAAERDEEVVAQPAGQGHVPAAPEVGRVDRLVRRVEVLREPQADHDGDADGHVAVAREVEVELQRVAEGRGPAGEQPEVGVVREEVVHVGRHHVGDQHLLGEAHDEEEEAGADERPAEALLRPLQLHADVAVADDRPGEDVREQRDPGQVVDHALGRLDHAAEDVDGVRDAGERVERDADRQQQLHRRQRPAGADQAEDAVERVDEEAAVLEVAEQRQVDRDGRRQEELAAAAGAPLGLALRQVVPGDPVDERGRRAAAVRTASPTARRRRATRR